MFNEVMRMIDANRDYCGVSFEHGARGVVSVLYESRVWGTGQSQEYSNEEWVELCLVARLMGAKAYRHGFEGLIRVSEGMGFNSTRLTVYPGAIRGDSLGIFNILLVRVDQVITHLYNMRLDILDDAGT